MREICTSGSAGGPLIEIHGTLYTGTKAETPETAKSAPAGLASAPYPNHPSGGGAQGWVGMGEGPD